MRRPIAIALVGAVATTVALVAPAWVAQAWGAEAQPAKAGSPGTSWNSIAHLPDWSGVWELDWHGGNLAKTAMPSLPKLTPEYAARLEKYRAAQQEGQNQQTTPRIAIRPGCRRS